MSPSCFPPTVLSPDAPLPSTGSFRASSPASAVLSGRYDFLPPVPPHFVFLRLAVPPRLGTLVSLPSVQRAAPWAGAFAHRSGSPLPVLGVETTGPPTFLGNPDCAYALLFDPGRTVRIRPIRCNGTAPAQSKTRAPTKPISGLNHTASALAVYASQDGSLRHHARLASGCWPNSTRRDWLPAGSPRKLSVCLTT